MATIKVPRQSPPTTIDRFLGINEDSAGDTQLQLGESPNMWNFRLTENYKLRKREGYEELFASLGEYDIQGTWYGSIGGSYHFLFAANGKVYEHDFSDGTNTEIGTLTDAETFFFSHGNKVYIINGNEYMRWDGTDFEEVAGYIPLVATSTPAAGGGTDNEQINLLTGKKRQRFNPDGTAKDFTLRETNITSVDAVYVDGVLKTVTTHYTVNLTTGVVTFVTAPATGEDSVEIYWTKGTGSRSEVTGNKFAMFYGGKNDTRVFIYGDGTNRYRYTGLANGMPSAEYFPAFGYNDIGSDEFYITDIVRQYDRQIIYTSGKEAWYSYYDTLTLGNGDVIADFPTFPLNDAVGHIATGQAQLIENNPFTIQNGVYEWQATNVRDERNAVYKSKRVQPSLDQEDLSTAITVDWEARKEYWLAIGNKIWIYNYRLDAWYKFQLADTVTNFIVINDELYFGTANGQIMKFKDTRRTDNGTTVQAYWEMNFYDFGIEWLRKFLNRIWVSIKPGSRERVDLTWQTDKSSSVETYTIEYNVIDFNNVDFEYFSFLTNQNPQPFRLKIKAKKFVYFKVVLENTSDTSGATVLSINLLARTGGETK